jgi:hypothetical protein
MYVVYTSMNSTSGMNMKTSSSNWNFWNRQYWKSPSKSCGIPRIWQIDNEHKKSNSVYFNLERCFRNERSDQVEICWLSFFSIWPSLLMKNVWYIGPRAGEQVVHLRGGLPAVRNTSASTGIAQYRARVRARALGSGGPGLLGVPPIKRLLNNWVLSLSAFTCGPSKFWEFSKTQPYFLLSSHSSRLSAIYTSTLRHIVMVIWIWTGHCIYYRCEDRKKNWRIKR